MKYEILEKGSYPALQVTLDAGEKVIAESGAMSWMDPTIDVTTAARGGILSGLKRSVLGGESFFQNEYTTKQAGSAVTLVAGQPGDLMVTEMEGQQILLERGAYLASAPTVNVDAKFQGLKGLFAEGMFVLQASGTGPMFWTGYGDIQEVQVSGEYVVDNGYAVAWDASLQYTVTKSGKKIRSFLFSDALVMRFSGHGRVWVQSRSPTAMSNWVYPFRRMRQKSN